VLSIGISLSALLLGIAAYSITSSKIRSSSQTIRFQDPNETTVRSNQTLHAVRAFIVVNFTWTPRDSSNNAILSAHYWAEFKRPNTTLTDFPIEYELRINNEFSDSSQADDRMIADTTYQPSNIHYWQSHRLPPSPTYTIEFILRFSDENELLVRNINVILTVIDG
jgi:hypothetical protein